jgi:hypothetical protein
LLDDADGVGVGIAHLRGPLDCEERSDGAVSDLSL